MRLLNLPFALLGLSLPCAAQVQGLPIRPDLGQQLYRERPLFIVRGVDAPPLPGFGYSVSGGRDVNRDGVPDLAIGSPYEGPQHLGQVRVVSGIDGVPILPNLDHPSGEYVGFSVALIGDLDGDQRSEILTGDPMFGGVGPGGTGQAFVFRGSDGSALFHVTGDNASDQFGWSVAAAGDVDGDQAPDFAVGAVEDHGSSDGPGYVRLFSGATGAAIRTYTIGGQSGRYGQSLVDAGDVNGDGVPDLLIGASASGFVHMRSGATGAVLWTRQGPGQFGWAVAAVGDVDADGQPDVAVGGTGLDYVRVLTAGGGANVTDIFGPAGDFFGGAIAGLGDVNGDGHDDLAIGAKWADSPVEVFTGGAWIRSGADGAVLGTYQGRFRGDRVGFALTSMGDVDGDGVQDLAIGANQEANSRPGYAAAFSGARR